MDYIITFMNKGYTIVDILGIIFFIVAIVRCVERFCIWVMGYLKSYYNRKKGIEEKENIIEKHSVEIKELTKRIDEMVVALDTCYKILVEKFDEQNNNINTLNQACTQRDRAILRDRITGGMRYFSQNTDEKGKVHITFGDYENMSRLFEEYFNCGGNGTLKQMYENDFLKWIVDR